MHLDVIAEIPSNVIRPTDVSILESQDEVMFHVQEALEEALLDVLVSLPDDLSCPPKRVGHGKALLLREVLSKGL